MNHIVLSRFLFIPLFLFWSVVAVAQQSPSSEPPIEHYLSPPKVNGSPVVVEASFHLQDLNAIDDEAETFEFGGILTLTWNDKRQVFDPADVGVSEKVYQGSYQFNELAPAWYPQVVLTNESGLFDSEGVILRVKPDGTCTLIQTIDAVAETDLDMRRYPFDRHRLVADFNVLGFDASDVIFEAVPAETIEMDRNVKISQWRLMDIELSTQESLLPYLKSSGPSSTLQVVFDVKRHSMFIIRLVVLPLFLIVMLSWSVFWMDRSSLGDRINVSFIGILTAVAYQNVISSILPHISYLTLINQFLNISFLLMCATVFVNLVVGAYDIQGRTSVGDILDRRCRILFPLFYLLSLLLITVLFLVF